MKIAVLNASNTKNYGSMMMLENYIYYTLQRHSLPKFRFEVLSSQPRETKENLLRALGGYASTVSAVLPPVGRPGLLNKLKRGLVLALGAGKGYPMTHLTQTVDIVVVLGGDDYTEDYGYWGALWQLARLRLIRRAGTPVVMLGQSIGPFRSWREPVARFLLRHVSVIVARDPVTYRYLRDRLRLCNVEQGADLALLPLASESEVVQGKPYFTVVPSELIWRYSKHPDRTAYVHCMTNICQAALDLLPQHTLILLPHVLAPDKADDRKSTRDIAVRLNEVERNRDRIVTRENTVIPSEARAILQGSEFVIAGRMHGAISALSGAVPTVSMSYSTKYWGIIGEQFGLQDWIVDVRGKSWVEVEDTVIQKMRRLIDGGEIVRKDVRARLKDLQSLAVRNIDVFLEVAMRKAPKNSSGA